MKSYLMVNTAVKWLMDVTMVTSWLIRGNKKQEPIRLHDARPIQRINQQQSWWCTSEVMNGDDHQLGTHSWAMISGTTWRGFQPESSINQSPFGWQGNVSLNKQVEHSGTYLTSLRDSMFCFVYQAQSIRSIQILHNGEIVWVISQILLG